MKISEVVGSDKETYEENHVPISIQVIFCERFWLNCFPLIEIGLVEICVLVCFLFKIVLYLCYLKLSIVFWWNI